MVPSGTSYSFKCSQDNKVSRLDLNIFLLDFAVNVELKTAQTEIHKSFYALFVWGKKKKGLSDLMCAKFTWPTWFQDTSWQKQHLSCF